MCTYSIVHDWAQKLPQDMWTRPMVGEYLELIERLKKIDEALKLPDCDKNKGEFLKPIIERLDRIERLLGGTGDAET